MPQHSLITDPNLHEPKGVSTAQVGQVYVSDGAGSGSWTYWPNGWGFYEDSGVTTQTFTTSYSKLLIDGLGSNTEEGYLPRQIRGSGSLYNTTTNRITPVSLGDGIDLRIDLPITAKGGSPSSLELVLDIGGGASPTIPIVKQEISVVKTPPLDLSTGFPIFCKETFLGNGGQIFIRADSGTVSIQGPAIYLKRTHGEF